MAALTRCLLFALFLDSPRAFAAIFHNSSPLHPRILADTNRDGVVNHLDDPNKHVWTARRGAIFLPNIGDSIGRCSAVDLTGEPLSNDELWRCHDASGDRLLTASLRYAAPLLTLPMQGVSDDAVGHVYTEPSHTRDRVRIFWDAIDSALVDRQLSFNASSLRRGISLRIDGRELVADSSVWDGSVRVVFEVSDGEHTARDVVALKQAPVLLHHHLQQPEVVLSTAAEAGSVWQAHFLSGLQEAVDEVPIALFNQSTDIWAQDFLEPGYASMPGPTGPISIRVLLRSAQSTRDAGRQVFSQLRGPGAGGFQPGRGSGFGFEEINSGGNIETIPPYTSRSGKRWASGRVIMGTHFGTYPASSMVRFLQSQGAQDPLFLETGWLLVGHVDEMVQFLPSNNTLGFTIAVADTNSAIALLRKAQSSGQDIPVVSYTGDATPDETAVFLDPVLLHNTTVASLLADESFLATNAYAQRYLDANLATLLRDLPLGEAEVLRVPTLFADVTYPLPPTPDGLPPRLNVAPPGKRQLKAMLPQALNGLVLGRKYVAPKQWGPVLDGRVIFEEAVKEVYGRAGMEVAWVDDYMSHHVRGGEVHCGTNTLREASEWWK
ncbi:Protein-arginine deiminase type-4 [Madurella mycetomatis]|uniref:Protein-arginine deiminase type-4 n=1 Tax=Madurella mycetomatis TaxID=100816 RepID=A0A175WEJ8_9PEZI|nr:Protein-arginine deiminase type-4 [Madurella mycetomatis]